MANNLWKEEIEDWVEGDINERVEKEVLRRYQEMVKRDNQGYGYSYEEEQRIKAQLRQEIREEFLKQKEFHRRYQDQRHLDEVLMQQREYDIDRQYYTEEHMQGRADNEKRAKSLEGNIYTDDIGRISPEAVVNHYNDIAHYFNIRDTETMEKIIKEAQQQNGNIDVGDFIGVIDDPKSKEMIETIIMKNNGNLNVGQLMEIISQLMTNNANTRVETSKGYMDVAKQDLDARVTGVERKVDALNKTASTSVKRDNAYLEALDNAYTQGKDSARKSEDEIRKRISLSAVEKATNGVRLSTIDDNIGVVEEKREDIGRE